MASTEEERTQSAEVREHLDAAQGARLIGAHGHGPEGDDAESLVDMAATSPQHAKRMEPQQKVDAMAWLLASDDTIEDSRLETWQFNVGTEQNQEWIDWTIRPLDADTMTNLRSQARAEGSNRASRRASRGSGEPDFDVTAFNLRMVAAATVEPDLREAARVKGVEAADPLYGPAMLLKHRFAVKPGIVDQIAGKVMLLSGYDEDDMRRATPEIKMVNAAGNS